MLLLKMQATSISPECSIRYALIHQRSRTNTWIYLGIPYTWAGRKKILISEIREKDLESLKKPLNRNKDFLLFAHMWYPSYIVSSHWLMSCIERHDAVSSYVALRLQNQSFVVQQEPHIQTDEGLRKPDIVAFSEQTVLVMDAQVVNKQFDLRRAHHNKANYYKQNPGIATYVHQTLKIPKPFRRECLQVD